MNLCFYESIERIPLGAAVTFEFIGPLGVAVGDRGVGWRLLWALLAGAGVLTSRSAGSRASTWGASRCRWARPRSGPRTSSLSARIGRAFQGGAGLALAMSWWPRRCCSCRGGATAARSC